MVGSARCQDLWRKESSLLSAEVCTNWVSAPVLVGPRRYSAAVVGGLDEDRRLLLGREVVSELPIWASILDDVWFGEQVDYKDQPSKWGADAAQRLQPSWQALGVTINEKKNVDDALVSEIQGYELDGGTYRLGSSVARGALLLKSMLDLLLQPEPRLGALEHALGKWGYGAAMRPWVRSIMGYMYRWQHGLRVAGASGPFWRGAMWLEWLYGLLWIRFMEIHLSSRWHPRCVCSDASPGGHGFTRVSTPTQMMVDIGKVCVHKGAYASLNLSFGLQMNELGRCPLQSIEFPRRVFY